MKKIESVNVWKNGQSQEANILLASIINDDLQSYCTFYYQLCSSGEGTEEMPLIIGECLANGTINLDGVEYLEWNGSNDYPYFYIADKLNLTII
jgi:hypothetical protein